MVLVFVDCGVVGFGSVGSGGRSVLARVTRHESTCHLCTDGDVSMPDPLLAQLKVLPSTLRGMGAVCFNAWLCSGTVESQAPRRASRSSSSFNALVAAGTVEIRWPSTHEAKTACFNA